jgi:di/tricarboxylate transporter
MIVQLLALGIFVAVFAIASMRQVHLGILMFAAACGVGLSLGGMPLRDIVGGFPLSIMVLLVGVTYFFAIAQVNGTVDTLIKGVLSRVGHNTSILPFVFFALAGGVAAMGSGIAGLVVAPIGLPIARRSGMDPMLMALAIGCGISAGAFAPTSLFGIVNYGTARQANIDLNPLILFGVAVLANVGLLIAASFIFGGRSVRAQRADLPGTHASPNDAGTLVSVPFGHHQIFTVVGMIGLIVAVITFVMNGIEPDIGVLAFALGALLALVDPASGKAAVSRIDWSTVLLVGGIVTFVGVLQTMSAVDVLGEMASTVSTPIVSALVICLLGALVSAFASTTGILAALVPLALPLVASGHVAGWALICALAVCASIVDVSPFSTVGATLIASAHEEERVRMTSLLTRWAMCMVVMGPIVLVGTLVLPSRF